MSLQVQPASIASIVPGRGSVGSGIACDRIESSQLKSISKCIGKAQVCH
jgi:hypothetical protein